MSPSIRMKSLIITLTICLLGAHVAAVNTNMRNKNRSFLQKGVDPDIAQNENNESLTPFTREELEEAGHILLKNWAKYLGIYRGDDPAESGFYLNKAYEDQFKEGSGIDYTKKDAAGQSVYVPSENHFWFVLTRNSIQVVTARENSLAKTFASLEMSEIDPMQLDENTGTFQGGIIDQGEFREQSCFRIRAASGAQKVPFYWEVCFDTPDILATWVITLKKLKLKSQFFAPDTTGVQGGGVQVLTHPVEVALSKEFGGGKSVANPDSNILSVDPQGNRDGRWINLQDWSTCTVACGGGTQTLQRTCLPPAGEGAPCEGDEIQTKACNTDPCPEDPEPQKKEEKELPAQMKMAPVSNRPQRFELCVIKEGDLDVVKEEFTQYAHPPRIPIRVVLNTKTISGFASDSFESVVFTMDLRAMTNIKVYESDKTCMVLDDEANKVVLCPMKTSKIPLKELRDEWIDHIYTFRDECNQTEDFNDNPSMKSKMGNLEEDVMKKASDHQDKLDFDEKDKEMTGSLIKKSTTAMEALTKELRLQELRAREERMKQRAEQKELFAQINEAKDKEDCVEKSLQEKEYVQDRQLYETDIEDEIEQVQKETRDEIEARRAVEAQESSAKERANERRKRKMQQELTDVRNVTAAKLAAAEREGDITQCTATSTEQYRDTYCAKAYAEDFDLTTQCLDADKFCYTCCYHEAKQEQMHDCFKQCEATETGKWVWVPKTTGANAAAQAMNASQMSSSSSSSSSMTSSSNSSTSSSNSSSSSSSSSSSDSSSSSSSSQNASSSLDSSTSQMAGSLNASSTQNAGSTVATR